MLLKELITNLSNIGGDYEVLFKGVMVADSEQYLFVEKIEVDQKTKRVYLC